MVITYLLLSWDGPIPKSLAFARHPHKGPSLSHIYIYIYIYRRLGEVGPTGNSFRFVRACNTKLRVPAGLCCSLRWTAEARKVLQYRFVCRFVRALALRWLLLAAYQCWSMLNDFLLLPVASSGFLWLPVASLCFPLRSPPPFPSRANQC